MEKTSAARIVRQTFQNPFNKESFVYFIKSLLNHIEPAPFIYRGNFIPDAYEPYIKTLERIGKYQDKDGKKIDLLIVRLKKETSLERARTMQRNFIAWYLNGSRGDVLKDAALVAFVSPDSDDWRFSLVKMDYRLDTSGEKVRVKQDLTPARRFSFLVGKNESSHTAQSRLVPILQDDSRDPTLRDLEEAFSVEKVTKEFFEKYRQLFHKVKESLDEIVKKDKKVQQNFKEKNIDTVNFAKKLLGQIVFLYFLQKKGWLGAKEKFGDGDRKFLRNLFEKAKKEDKYFFNDYLKFLFYDALNNERRGSADPSYHPYFGCKIPFLNGGLFEPLGNYDWKNTDITLPNELFSNDFRTKQGDVGTGILDIFDRYNFTVKEDEPLEKEVAVDPEMLGKVFENLLEVKDRKSKGTYYTPREIVHYMCQQSLINYLKTECSDIEGKKIESLINPKVITKKDYQKFRKTGGRKEQVIEGAILVLWEKEAEELDKKLKTIRICDPACGSGAFLVGMMQEIISARKRLNFILNKEIDSYELKRHTIQNCLYGVDIDPGAVEIAKLRLWLSLVVDYELEEIEPLPNLDYKIMQGNSLVELLSEEFLKGSTDQRRVELINKFKKAKDELFNISSSSQKKLKRQEINELIKELFEYDRNLIIKNLKQEIKGIQNQGRLFTDARFKRGDKKRIEELKKKIEEVQKIKVPGPSKHFEWHINFSEVFQEKGGFDVVIGNPPWVSNDNISKDDKLLFQKIYQVAKSRFDLANLFVEKSIKILDNDGFLFFVMPEHIWLGEYFIPFREYIAGNAKIIEILSSKEESFERTANPSSIFLIQNARPLSAEQEITLGSFNKRDKPNKFKIKTNIIKRVIFNEFVQKLIKKIDTPNLMTLDQIALVTDGIQTANVLKLLFTQNPEDKERYRKALRSGKSIKFRYAPLKWDNWWVLKPEYTKKLKRPGFSYDSPKRIKCFLSKEKIILRQTEPTIFATLDKDGYFFPNSIFQIALKQESSRKLKGLLGVINSKFLRFYYSKLSQVEGTTKPQIYLNLLKSLPIPKEINPKISTLVDKILTITKADDYLQNKTKQKKVKEYEKKIDQLVYKLYGLTPEEIKIVESN